MPRPPTPIVPLASETELGESPLWPVLAVLSAAGLYATLPGKFVTGPSSGAAGAFSVARWVVPVLAILLIAPLALSVPQQRLIKSAEARATALRVSRRVASLGVIALLTLANVGAIILLVRLLIQGSHTEA